MRNFITLLAILFTGMVIAQRPDVNRTFRGVTFQVETVASSNTLAISNPTGVSGTFSVVDGDFLDPMYEYVSTSISMNILINNSANPSYAGPINVISFENLTWHRPSRVDWSTILDKNALPQNRGDDLHIIRENMGVNRDFILTLNIGTFAIRIGDNGAYTVFEIGLWPLNPGETVRYRDSNGFCNIITPENGFFEVLKPGPYTITTNGVHTRYTLGPNAEVINVEPNVEACVSN